MANLRFKFRAFLKNIKWLLPVLSIDFDTEDGYVEVDLTGEGDYADYKFKEIELMQYTGLKDKNGVEIFEGDILNLYIPNWCGVDRLQKFIVATDSFYGHVAYLEAVVLHCKEHNEYGDDDYLEIIGNIYENPELLEATK